MMTNMTTGGLLEGKVALVTGAGRGIGAAAARLFAAEGAAVVLTARSTDELAAVTTQITTAGGSATYVAADLAQHAEVDRAVQVAMDTYGRLDVAFNNAGVPGAYADLTEIDDADLDRVLTVNVKSVVWAIAAEVRAMRAGGRGGAIVNNSSVGSWRANPGIPDYGASKRAVNSLTQSAAAAYGPEGIRVNGVAPGTTMTEMMADWAQREPGLVDRLNERTPLRRAAQPEEIAQAAAWLASDRASYVTGVLLPVDGGVSA